VSHSVQQEIRARLLPDFDPPQRTARASVWSDRTSCDEARIIAERDIVDALPALRALGLFDVLSIRDDRLRAFIDAYQ
jgi:hypothetical protein